ncbi:unnamed protein product [Gongylonema pulchrum]|uniref:Uncharacterized protein n=1 Tax=Gongylonema pulchrum TaxID=637853 RepID=A0A183EGP9_9BILA|nr:unnamed protein product [Gongylonema pulchrum]
MSKFRGYISDASFNSRKAVEFWPIHITVGQLGLFLKNFVVLCSESDAIAITSKAITAARTKYTWDVEEPVFDTHFPQKTTDVNKKVTSRGTGMY